MKKSNVLKTIAAGSMTVTGMIPNSLPVLAQETEEGKNQTTNIPEAVETVTDAMLALDQKIMDAKEDMDVKQEALETAQGAYTEAQQAEAPAQEAYNTAMNTFDSHTGEINEQINAELEAQIAKLEQTQKEIDQMTSQKESYENKLSELNEQKKEAQEKANELQAQYEEALKLAESLTPEDIENARLALENAQSELQNLENQISTLTSEINTAQGLITEKQNQIAALTTEADGLYQTWQAAIADRQAAETNYNTLVAELQELQDPNAQQELQEKLAAAENTLVEKQNAEATALSNYQTAQGATQTAQNELATAQQTVTDKQNAYNTANEKYQEQLETINTLEQQVADYEAAAEEAYGKYEAALAEVSRLNGEKTKAENQLKEIESQITTTNNQITSLEEALEQAGSVDEEVAETMKGFFQYLGDEKALAILDQTNGMSLDDLKTSLEYIQECNELRAQESLDPLKVNSQLMALAYKQATQSAEIYKETGNLEHTGTDPHVGENLAVDQASTDPFNGWYDTEKKVYDYLQEHSLEYKDLTDDDKAEIAKELGISSSMVQVGHYLNIVTPTYQNTGFALIPYKIEYAPGYYFDMYVSGQTFSNGSYYAADSMSLEDYLKALETYESTLSGASADEIREQINELKSQLATLKGQQTTVNEQIGGYETQIKEQQTIQSENYVAYNKNNTFASVAKQDVEDAKKELTPLEEAKDTAYSEWETAKTTASKKQTALTAAQKEEETKKGLYEAAQEETKQAQDVVDGIKYTIEHLDRVIEEKTEEKTKLETETIPALKQAENVAETNYNNKLGEIDPIKEEIKTLKTEIATKQGTITSLKEQKPNLESKVESAQATYDQYLTATDSTKLEALKQEADNAEQAVTDIEGTISEINTDLGAVEADLKNANETKTTQTARKTLLEALQKEFQAIASGESVSLLTSEDAFVQSIQAKYPLVQEAYRAMTEAKAELEKLQGLTHAAKEQVEQAQAEYGAAKATYDALIKEMNDLINDSLEEEQPSEEETTQVGNLAHEAAESDSKSKNSNASVHTATALNSQTMLLAMGVSALGILRLEQRKRRGYSLSRVEKNSKSYSDWK